MSTSVIPINISKDVIANLGEQFNPLFQDIRIYGTIEKPLFVSRDVEKALSLNDIHIRDRANFKEGLQFTRLIIPTNKGPRETIVLTEYGLYQAMFNSASPLAEEYCRFIVIVMQQLRTQGVVTLESSLKELKAEKARLQTTVNMLDETAEDLKYKLNEAEEENENRRAVAEKLNKRLHDADQNTGEAETIARKTGNVEYVTLLEKALMQLVYIHVSGIDEQEAGDLPDNEVYYMRLSTKKTLRGHHMAATAMMVNPTKQISKIDTDQEISLTDLRDIIESSNLSMLRAI